MDQASEQCAFPDAPGDDFRDPARFARIVIHLAVAPAQTIAWRVPSESQLRVHGARVWLTRIGSPYDYWMQPGDAIRLQRGERIWLSTDAGVSAEVSLTSHYVEPRGVMARWLAGMRGPAWVVRKLL
jgi:hypothetical protein